MCGVDVLVFSGGGGDSSSKLPAVVGDVALVTHFLPRLATDSFWATLLVYGAPAGEDGTDESEAPTGLGMCSNLCVASRSACGT